MVVYSQVAQADPS